MDTVLTLGGLDGPGDHLVDDASRVLVDHRGQILLTTTPSHEIAVFDADGRFLREIGGAGEGPGEYMGIADINVGPKYVHVFDIGGRTLLDADHSFVGRDGFWAQSGSGTVTESETVVFAGDVPTSDSFGHHLHILHENGSLHSYGWNGRGARGPTWRWFAVAANDTIAWIVHARSNRVETWTLVPMPRLSRVFIRSFEKFDREATANPLWPGTFNIRARHDDRGLWILWGAPDPGWTLRTGDSETADQWYLATPMQTIEDGVLDLIDPMTGRTLARHRSDLPLLGFVDGSDMVTAYEETEAGVPRLHLLRPTVHR